MRGRDRRFGDRRIGGVHDDASFRAHVALSEFEALG
jgi:hypothetical protein